MSDEPKCDPAAFAKAIVRLWWEHDSMDIDGCEFQEVAEKHGIIIYRTPTKEEFEDPDWFGHEVGIELDDPGVGEFHPDLADHAIASELQKGTG